MAKKPPRWYFSFRSPYSWLAYRDLVDRYPDVAMTVQWRPFWEPDELSQQLLMAGGGQFPYVPMSKEKHRYILQDVRRLVAERGLSFSWPVDREPHWEIAHLAYLAAEREGRGREFIAAVYRARWEQGRDISERSTMAELGAELGLDPELLANASDDPEVRDLGVAALQAVYRDGVFGVPFFVHGYDKFWGLDRLGGFVSSLYGGLSPVDIETDALLRASELVSAGDGGHAGGCG
jgi:2-hydroxychromene-2-carboxylate isomerase